MLRHGRMIGIAWALCLAGCGDSAGNEPAAANDTNVAAPAAETPAANAAANAANPAFPCAFEADDSRNWAAWINAMPGPGSTRPLIVTGEARVAQEGYTATLIAPQVAPPVLQLTLSVAAHSGPHPAGGWHRVRYEMPNAGNIQTVVIICGDDEVARLPVEIAH